MPPADTRRVSDFASRLAALTATRHCACTFYLVFKEPACPAAVRRTRRPESPRSPPAIFPSGEPCNLTDRTPTCQPFSRRFVDFRVEAFEAVATRDQRTPPP